MNICREGEFTRIYTDKLCGFGALGTPLSGPDQILTVLKLMIMLDTSDSSPRSRVGSHQNWIIPANSFDSKNLRRRTINMTTFPRILQIDGSVESELLVSVPEFNAVVSKNKSEY